MASWNGKLAGGVSAPPGDYLVSVSGSAGSGTANAVPPYTARVRVLATGGTMAATLRLVEQHPGHVAGLQWLTQRALERGDVPLAEARARALLEADRSLPSRMLAVRSRILSGDLDGAGQTLDAEPEQKREVFDVEIALALAWSARDQADTARSRLEDLEKTWSLTTSDSSTGVVP